jgi:hypothetical protein
MSTKASPSEIIAVDPGTVVLRGTAVTLDTEVGRAFILDCARNIEGQLSEEKIRSKYELTAADWKGLADNIALLHAVRAEHERRVLKGEAGRELAQRYASNAPNILNAILADERVSPRHRIEAARELRQAANSGPEVSAEPKERVVINIDLGADCKVTKEYFLPARLPPEEGEVP